MHIGSYAWKVLFIHPGSKMRFYPCLDDIFNTQCFKVFVKVSDHHQTLYTQHMCCIRFYCISTSGPVIRMKIETLHQYSTWPCRIVLLYIQYLIKVLSFRESQNCEKNCLGFACYIVFFSKSYLSGEKKINIVYDKPK